MPVLLYLYAWIVPDNVSVFPEEFVKLVDVKVLFKKQLNVYFVPKACSDLNKGLINILSDAVIE